MIIRKSEQRAKARARARARAQAREARARAEAAAMAILSQACREAAEMTSSPAIHKELKDLAIVAKND